MICKECKLKLGYEFTATGFHTVTKAKCAECGEVKSIWPARHFKMKLDKKAKYKTEV